MKCSNCAFWEPHDSEQRSFGFCRIFPPIACDDRCVFPQTEARDWCARGATNAEWKKIRRRQIVVMTAQEKEP